MRRRKIGLWGKVNGCGRGGGGLGARGGGFQCLDGSGRSPPALPLDPRGDGWAEAASGKRTFGRGNFGEVSRNFPESASAKC